jgi:hypothetical protein
MVRHLLVLAGLVVMTTTLAGCICGPTCGGYAGGYEHEYCGVGHGGCGGGCDAGCGECCDGCGPDWNHHPLACGPIDAVRHAKRSLVCGAGCGDVYYGEWLSTPPCCDPCQDCGVLCGRPPRIRPFRLVGRIVSSLYGYRFCETCCHAAEDCCCDRGDVWYGDEGDVYEGDWYDDGQWPEAAPVPGPGQPTEAQPQPNTTYLPSRTGGAGRSMVAGGVRYQQNAVPGMRAGSAGPMAPPAMASRRGNMMPPDARPIRQADRSADGAMMRR